MDESTNPYQAPASSGQSRAAASAHSEELQSVFRSLARWQTFFAVIALLVAILMFFVTAAGTFFGSRGRDILGAVFMLLFMTAVAVIVYLIPAMLLFRAASTARNAGHDENEPLDALLRAQLAFWRYAGIVAIVLLVFYAIAILFAAVRISGISSL